MIPGVGIVHGAESRQTGHDGHSYHPHSRHPLLYGEDAVFRTEDGKVLLGVTAVTWCYLRMGKGSPSFQNR